MKTLFISPQHWARESIQLKDYPLGLCHVAAAVKAANHDVVGLDLNFEPWDAKVVRAADVIMTGGLCTHWKHIREIVEIARRLNPKARIILGGGVVSGDPPLALKHLGADWVVAGEGEIEAPRLLSDIASGREPGDGNRIIMADPIQDLDSLPEPLYEIFNIEEYLSNQFTNQHYFTFISDRPRALATISSRGCPFDCSFCFHPLGRGFRTRSVDSWIAEVERMVHRFDVNILCVVDEVLGLNRQRLLDVSAGLKRLGVPWMAQLRPDILSEETAELLADSGCFFLSVGIESGSQETLYAIGKQTTVADIDRALSVCRKHHIGVQGNVLFGFPEETDATMAESILWWARHWEDGLYAAVATPYPNSRLYQQFRAKGLLDDPVEWMEAGCPNRWSYHQASEKVSKEFSDFFPHVVHGLAWRYMVDRAEVKVNWLRPFRNAFEASLKCRCPACGCDIDYPRIVVHPTLGQEFICRHCWRRFGMNMPDILRHQGGQYVELTA